MQKKQTEWHDQWSRFKDDSSFLFQEWIYPQTFESFRNKRVLDAGCGPGHHMRMVAPFTKEIIGADLNTSDIARKEIAEHKNASIVEGDLATVHFDNAFDVVYCIGVIHHTDDPNKTFENLKSNTKAGGLMIVWAYSHEGNFWNRTLIEGLKKIGLLRLPKTLLHGLAILLTAILTPIIYSIYFLPLRRILPYYDYFGNFRKLSFHRNMLNAFDKLNAPQTFFIKKEQAERWFNDDAFENVHMSHYKGVSWRCSGIKRH